MPPRESSVMYYENKIAALKDLFSGRSVSLQADRLIVDGRVYPVVDDVIILLDPEEYPPSLARKLLLEKRTRRPRINDFAEDIQFTFGEEWKRFGEILPEHEKEFSQYFDLIDPSELKDARVCDLGCGTGRWSFFLSGLCREIVLVDFSEAIFIARRNLSNATNALFFMGDLCKLPFREDFADFIFSLGVLHHLPTAALDEARALKRYAPKLLFYLYYALDNRPFHFWALLAAVAVVRRTVSRVRNPVFRSFFTWFASLFIYLPLVGLGMAARPLGLGRYVPLHDSYAGKSLTRIRQDVYDRFFTGIEQRIRRNEICSLEDTYSKVIVSDALPYWHFLCIR